MGWFNSDNSKQRQNMLIFELYGLWLWIVYSTTTPSLYTLFYKNKLHFFLEKESHAQSLDHPKAHYFTKTIHSFTQKPFNTHTSL